MIGRLSDSLRRLFGRSGAAQSRTLTASHGQGRRREFDDDGVAAFYGEIVQCSERCKGIVRDKHTSIPRGFFTEAVPGDSVTLMLVAGNPGQPMHRNGEHKLYKGLSGVQAATKHFKFARRCFLGPCGKRFHRNTVAWMMELLHVDKDEVFKHVVYTNVVKCTTPKDRCPTRNVVVTCGRLHLAREIRLWRPRIVIALGKRVRKFLTCLNVEHKYLPHPAHREGADYHKPYLVQIREKL